MGNFFKLNFFEKFFLEYYRSDPDQVRQFVGPDLDPNPLQRLSADGTSRQRVKVYIICWFENSSATVHIRTCSNDFMSIWLMK